MPKVESFAIRGVTCWFWSHDHDPPHFHVKKTGKWEIKVHFTRSDAEMFEQAWGEKPRGSVLKALLQAVRKHRARLLIE